MSDESAITAAQPGESRTSLYTPSQSARGLVSLVFTQFFNATNDNILKGVLIHMVIDRSWGREVRESSV